MIARVTRTLLDDLPDGGVPRLDTDPPAAGNYLNPTPGNFGEYLQGDDVLGRYFTAGVRFRL